MLHLFLKARQDTGNCSSAWVIPGQLFFVTPGTFTWGSAGVHWIRRQLCLPYKRCLFIIKSTYGTSSAGTTQEDCARQKATTGAAVFILPAGNGPRSTIHPATPRICLRSCWLLQNRRNLKWSTILHLDLLWISTPLLSLVLLCLAEQKSLSADHVL